MNNNIWSIGVDRYIYLKNPEITKITNTDNYDMYINYWENSYDQDLVKNVSTLYPNLYIQNDVSLFIEKNINNVTTENNCFEINEKFPTLFINPSPNYLHFLYETLGRILYLNMLNIEYNLVLISNFKNFEDFKFNVKFLQSPFDVLKINSKINHINVSDYKNIKINQIIDTNPNFIITLESYGFVSKLLRDFFRKPGIPEKNIYISRKNANKDNPRYIKDEYLIENYYKDQGYDVVYNENLTFDEQINLYSNAKNIVGISGTGLINILFAPNECTITELRTSNYRDDNVFKYVSGYVGNNYKLIKSYNSNGSALAVLEDIKNIDLS